MEQQLQAIYDDPSHAADIDLTCQNNWDSVSSFDWQEKVANTTVDVIRGIQVGQTKSAHGVRMVLIRFVDTSIEHVSPPGGAWYDWTSTQPSVWAIAFAAPKIRQISSLLTSLPSQSADSHIVHREPWIRPSSWQAEAQWIVEESGITGVRIIVQASQDLVPTCHEVRFMTQGHYFRFVSTTDVSPDPWDVVSAGYLRAIRENELPQDQALTQPRWVPPKTTVPIKTNYQAEGDSPIECDMDDGATTYMFQSMYEPENVIQVVTSGKITLRNSTGTDMYIKNIRAEYSVADGPKQPCVGAKDMAACNIGSFSGKYNMMGIPHSDVVWNTDGTTSWAMPAKSVHEVCIRAVVVVSGATALSSKPLNMRIHPILAEPITVRATLEDDQGLTKSIYWDCSSPPLEQRVNSYDEVLASEKLCNGNGLGKGFACKIFLYWDDPTTWLRTYVIVTKSNDCAEWYIRASETTGPFPSSGGCTRSPRVLSAGLSTILQQVKLLSI